MPVMLVAFDEQMRIVAWNRECERVTGYRTEEMIGQLDTLKLLYPNEADRTLMVHDRPQGDNSGDWEWSFTAKNGKLKKVIWLNLARQVSIPGWNEWGIGLDVTTRWEAEGRLSAFFQSSSDALVFAAIDGLLLDVNEAFMRLTGYAREDVINRIRFQDITPPQYHHEDQKAVEEMVKSGLSQELDNELICKDRSSVPVQIRAFVVRAADGMAIGMGAIIKKKSNTVRSERSG